MIIYKAINKINGKVYIGQTINGLEQRKREHKNHSNLNSIYHFHNAIRKYGFDNFEWEVLHENVCDLDTLNCLEEIEIILHNSFHIGYNMNNGGKNCRPSEKTRIKMSKSQIGRKHSKETKEKMSKSHIGRTFTTEHKMNISKSRYISININNLIRLKQSKLYTDKELAYIFNTSSRTIRRRLYEYKSPKKIKSCL